MNRQLQFQRGRAATLVTIAVAASGTAWFAASSHAATRDASPSMASALAVAASTTQRPRLPGLPFARDELQEPKLFQSDRGVLDVLMIAHEAAVDLFSPFSTNGWVYEICPRPSDGSESCPRGSSSSNEYGGTRLQIEPGDTLKVRLVNLLPFFTLPNDPHDPVNPHAPHAKGRSQNPTSLHTHGLLVSPHYAVQGLWGDNAFARVFNVANGKAPDFEKMMGPVLYDHIDYEYDIPATHPSGLFWFHPHAHGLTQAQMTSGMSGVLTIGHVADEICSFAFCREQLAQVPQRHLLLKDTQIESDGTLALDQDTGFCSVDNRVGSSPREHQGGCDGQRNSPISGIDHTGGHWFYSINGQTYPSITVGMPTGQIWRVVNGSGNTTYDLELWLPREHRQMQMQVLSLDGVSVGVDSAKSASQQNAQAAMAGATPCRPIIGLNKGLCTMRLHMMPATRAEIWIGYRDADGVPVHMPAPAQAILRTPGFNTGPIGDNYPAIDLAKVDFGYGQVDMPGDGSVSVRKSSTVMPQIAGSAYPTASGAHCGPLAPGHMRRIFFNLTQPSPAIFGLGYEEIDQNGMTVPGTFVDVRPFDHMNSPLCLSLNPGNKPEVERWQLVNLSGEDHNFHIHQARFTVVDVPTVSGTVTPRQLGARVQLIDSVPLQHAAGLCDSVEDWRHGRCRAHVATVEIPFMIAGDFVFHCHVLEHEDGGMMAGIRVLPNN